MGMPANSEVETRSGVHRTVVITGVAVWEDIIVLLMKVDAAFETVRKRYAG